MSISTKFDLGQTVVVIWHGPTEHNVACTVCGATGWITLADKRYLCPECHGHGYVREHVPARWHVEHTGIVGRIAAETAEHEDINTQEHQITETPVGRLKINYMIDATGVGSGTLHYEPNVFATVEEAEAECARRNATPE